MIVLLANNVDLCSDSETLTETISPVANSENLNSEITAKELKIKSYEAVIAAAKAQIKYYEFLCEKESLEILKLKKTLKK